MTDSLKHYMVTLASDLDALSAFVQDPVKAIRASGLSEEDEAVLTSGDQMRIYLALSGLKQPEVAQPNASTSHAAAAAPQPSPSYPMVVGWAGPAPQPAGYAAPGASIAPGAAWPTQPSPSPPWPAPQGFAPAYQPPTYPPQSYPTQASGFPVPPWLTEWVTRWWASVNASPGNPPPPPWTLSWPGHQ